MARFSYKAVNQNGMEVTGLVEASDRRVAIADLAGRGFFVSDIDETTTTDQAMPKKDISAGLARLRAGSISSRDILAFTSQISTAIRAGLPILNALRIILAQQTKPSLKQLIQVLADDVSSGLSLSDAMEKHPAVFSRLYISMVRTGETGGILDQTIKQLAELLGREEKIRSNMKSASAYPLLVLSVGIVSVILMLTLVLPRLVRSMGIDFQMLPWPTRLLVGTSSFLLKFGWLLALLISAGLYFFVRWKKTPAGRLAFDSFMLSIPVLGKTLQTIAVARFARTLGALTKSGITILYALSVVRDTLGNEQLASAIDQVADKVRVGEPVAEPLERTGLFPPLLVQIVAIGEQTGRLDELLLNTAETFDEQADAAITRFMALFPAVMILLLALVIGFIIVAMLLPIVAMDLSGLGL